MKQKIIITTMLSWIIVLAWCSLILNTEDWQNGVWNPASEYCEQNWWTLEIVPDEWWSRWKCNFDDWSFCEERAYFHWECSPGRWDGNTIDIEEIQENEEISQEDKEEIVELIEEIKEINEEEQLQKEEITCTTDVKMCDDWTYVSRWWPNCEFWPCPGVELNEDVVKDTLKKYESTGSELTESDIEMMNEIINIMTE